MRDYSIRLERAGREDRTFGARLGDDSPFSVGQVIELPGGIRAVVVSVDPSGDVVLVVARAARA